MKNWLIAFIFVIIQNLTRVNLAQNQKLSIKLFFKKYWDDILLSILSVTGLMLVFCNELGINIIRDIDKIDKYLNGINDNILLMLISLLIGLFNFGLVKIIMMFKNKK